METTASQEIDDIIKKYVGWKGTLIAALRATIRAADSGIVEEIKWRMKARPEGLPVWSHDGIVCYIETFKDNLKLVFPQGVQLQDTHGLFNAKLQASAKRAIEFHEDDSVPSNELKQLISDAVQLRVARKR